MLAYDATTTLCPLSDVPTCCKLEGDIKRYDGIICCQGYLAHVFQCWDSSKHIKGNYCEAFTPQVWETVALKFEYNYWL